MAGNNVVVLCPVERVHQDAEAIASIYRSLGPTSAEQVVARAFAELAMSLTDLARMVQDQQKTEFSRGLRRLQIMAENLGMASLALVAADLRGCVERHGDGTTFAALWARLVRVAERSLAFDKGVQDLTLA